jgi:hypothetical protein
MGDFNRDHWQQYEHAMIDDLVDAQVAAIVESLKTLPGKRISNFDLSMMLSAICGGVVFTLTQGDGPDARALLEQVKADIDTSHAQALEVN